MLATGSGKGGTRYFVRSRAHVGCAGTAASDAMWACHAATSACFALISLSQRVSTSQSGMPAQQPKNTSISGMFIQNQLTAHHPPLVIRPRPAHVSSLPYEPARAPASRISPGFSLAGFVVSDPGRELVAAAYPQLGEDTREVILDGLRAQVQLGGGLAVGESRCHQSRYPEFLTR